MNSKLIVSISLIWICSCQAPQPDQSHTTSDASFEIRHAKNFSIQEHSSGVVVTVLEPYKGAERSLRYLLTDDIETASGQAFDGVIETPVNSIVATATSQVGFLDLTEDENLLVGYTTTDFVSSKTVRARIEEGKIRELGRDAQIDLEGLLELSPDLLIAYSASTDVSQWDQAQQFGTPVVFDASFLEPTPLAQAEWIKFFAAFTGKLELADSIFKAIEENYQSLVKTNVLLDHRPTVICGTMYNGTWFMPGGESWVATYIDHAGGRYLWQDIEQTGSTPLSFEAVFERSLNADLWIGATAFQTYGQIIKEDNRYLEFKAVRDSMIFTPTKRLNGLGGNDYYESGVTRPDIVLRDFIKILNLSSSSDEKLTYYRRIR